MGNYVYQTATNRESDSQYDVLGHLMPAKVFVFVVVDEPGRDGFLVRQCYTDVNNPYLQELKLGELGDLREVYPEKYGLWGKAPGSDATVAEHVMGAKKITGFASTSSDFPDGATRFKGKTVYIDIAKAKRSGAKLVTGQEIRDALDEYARQNPHLKKRIATIRGYSEALDKEILIQPNPSVPPSGVFTPQGLGEAFSVVKYARVVQVLSIAFTAYDLSVATNESFKAASVRPIENEVVRQMGGWGGAIAGARIGAAAGAVIGVETGPGAVITGLIGGIVFGAIGYLGGSFAAAQIPAH
ncbi:glycine zipper family protein [Paraburkholderia sp. ZP32-5]|uniref:glycine zipper family protein n=1 Tax=Paraburkholderia sp. ZP32-5 TaxID=2883245 RepID=UPI001F372C99|nr:glycine zipper family protein [Paraburkholderia sp. ZP32-5]